MCSGFGSARKPRWKRGEDSGVRAGQMLARAFRGSSEQGPAPPAPGGNLEPQNHIPRVLPRSGSSSRCSDTASAVFPLKMCPRTSPLLFRELPSLIPPRECRLLRERVPAPAASQVTHVHPVRILLLLLLLFSAIFEPRNVRPEYQFNKRTLRVPAERVILGLKMLKVPGDR